MAVDTFEGHSRQPASSLAAIESHLLQLEYGLDWGTEWRGVHELGGMWEDREALAPHVHDRVREATP